MKDLGLVDIWRECNPQAKTYSCYSSTFQTYSRIDYFLISSELRSKIHNSFYDSIVMSDHAPCCLVYKDDRLTKDPPRWCLQHKWLQVKEFVKYIGKLIEEFFKINTTQTTACIRWEAFKAFLRGHIISYTGSKSKKAREERLDLEKKMKTLQEKVYETNNPQLEKELLILRSEYDKNSAFKAASSLLRQKQSFNEQGDKSGKLLAWQIRQLETRTAITTITSNGNVVVNPIEINDAFRDYYEKLYDTTNTTDVQNMNRILDE